MTVSILLGAFSSFFYYRAPELLPSLPPLSLSLSFSLVLSSPFLRFLLRYATIRSSFLNACALYSIRRTLAVIRRGEEHLARLLSVIIRQVVINWKPGSDKAEPGNAAVAFCLNTARAQLFFRSKVSPLDRGRSPENSSREYSFHLRSSRGNVQ